MAKIFDILPKSRCELYLNGIFWQEVEIHDIKNRYFYPVIAARGNKMVIEFERRDGTNEFHLFGFLYAAE